MRSKTYCGLADTFQFIPKLIKYYREGQLPIDKIVKFYKVRFVLSLHGA